MTEHAAAAETAPAETHPPGEPHGADDHGGDHGPDDHGHAEAALGPVNWTAWGAGLGGVLLGLVVVAGLVLSLNWLG